jgi:hypothetical protein
VAAEREAQLTFAMLEVGSALTEARIAALEQKLAVVLPADYRMFLTRNNGGRPDPRHFPIYGLHNNPFGGIQIFFEVDCAVQSANIDWNHVTYLGRIPKNLLPIACDDGGNLICLSLGGADRGAVYYWDHDDEHSPPSYDNVYLIAQTFGEFLDSIYLETAHNSGRKKPV